MSRKLCKVYGNRCIGCKTCIAELRPWLFEKATYNIYLYGEEAIVEKPKNAQKTLEELF